MYPNGKSNEIEIKKKQICQDNHPMNRFFIQKELLYLKYNSSFLNSIEEYKRFLCRLKSYINSSVSLVQRKIVDASKLGISMELSLR